MPRPKSPKRNLPCPVCGATSFRSLLDVPDADGSENALVRCRICALVVVAREPSRQELQRCYAEYSYGSEDAWRVPAATEASLAGLAARLRRFRASGRLLDVGCGAGAILSVMARDGWQAEGTELSSLAAARLRSQGHCIHVGELEELDLPECHYDVVILSEIVEHLLEPRAALDSARRLLRPGGALYLTTPNFDALSRRLLGARWRVITLPEHIRYFNPASLATVLARTSLRVDWLGTEGLSPPELWASLRGTRSHSGFEGTETLRRLSVASSSLKRLKAAVNGVLRATSLGDTLKALAIRSGDSM